MRENGTLHSCFKLLLSAVFASLLAAPPLGLALQCVPVFAQMHRHMLTHALTHRDLQANTHPKHTFSAPCKASLLPPLPWWLHCMFELSITLQQKHLSLSLSLWLCLCSSLVLHPPPSPLLPGTVPECAVWWGNEDVWYGLHPGWRMYTRSAAADDSRMVRL